MPIYTIISKVVSIRNDGAKTPWIWPLTPLHLPSTFSRL